MVTIYTASWCGFCHTTKRYLDQLGIKYEEKDVEKDPASAKAAVAKSGQMGIPVIDVNGAIVVGFDKPKLDDALKANGLV